RTPLSAISRSNWSPESAEVRPLFKAPREDGSWFRAIFWTVYALEKPNEGERGAGLQSTIQPQQKMKTLILRNSILRATFIAGLLAAPVLLLSIQTSHAGSATWQATPATGDWNTAANWTAGGPPNGSADTATFASSN